MENEKNEINPVIASAFLQKVILNAPLSQSDRNEALIYLRGLTEHISEIKKEITGLKNEKTA